MLLVKIVGFFVKSVDLDYRQGRCIDFGFSSVEGTIQDKGDDNTFPCAGPAEKVSMCIQRPFEITLLFEEHQPARLLAHILRTLEDPDRFYRTYHHRIHLLTGVLPTKGGVLGRKSPILHPF